MEQKRGWKRRVQHLLDITMISFFFLSFFFFDYIFYIVYTRECTYMREECERVE